MHPYSLICCDIDGTLLNSDHTISERTKRAVRAVVGRGIAVALVSGRSPQSLTLLQEELSLTGPLGCFNGALSLDAEQHIIDEQPIDYRSALRALDELAHTELEFFLYTNESWYVQAHNRWYDSEVALTGIPGTIAPLRELESLLEGDEKPFKLLAMHRDRFYITDMTGELAAHFAGRLNIFNSHPLFIEIMAPDVDKGRSVRAFEEHYQVTRDRVAAIGDYYNDIPMFQAVGLAVAMGNAPPGVQAHAHQIAPANTEEGLARFLESLV